MSFDNSKINISSFQPRWQWNNSIVNDTPIEINTPIFGNDFDFMPTSMGVPSFENYFSMDLSQFAMQNPFGLMNFALPQIDYTKLLENAMKMQNEYIQMLQNQQKIAMENTKKAKDNPNLPEYKPEDPKNISYDAKELKEKWSKIKPDLTNGFYEKVVEIAKKINCSPDALMAVMKAESGIKTTEKNPKGSATGLIQFTEETAKTFNTSTEALKKMSAEEQLEYVEKYLKYWKKTAGYKNTDFIDSATLYALVFLPAYSKRNVLTQKGEEAYSWNPGLDINKDGYITKTELGQRTQDCMA